MRTNKEIWILIILTAIIIALTVILVFVDKDGLNLPFLNSDNDVEVYNIKANQEVDSPLIVEGKAKGTYFFEASFPIRILDEAGNVLGSSYVQAQSDWMTEDYVDFKGQITFSTATGGKGFLVFAKDNPSGLPEYDKEMRIPVILKPTGMTTVKVYFNNSKLDPEFSCNKVFPVEREIAKIEAIGSAAIQELLKGTTDAEEADGFFTSINQGVRMQSLEIKNGTAYVDFDNQLENAVGGSCRVSAIRTQITETLKQFSTINNVIISINGRIEDILQP
jgi:hypothetical protein